MPCIECGYSVSRAVYDYSIENFGFALCRNHQDWIRSFSETTTDEAITLYLCLRQSGIDAELEKGDGFKTVDICIEDAKIHIEVDGKHHHFNADQALCDLKRTYHSFQKGYFTLRIPNKLIQDHLEETVDYITDLLELSRQRVENAQGNKRFGYYRRNR